MAEIFTFIFAFLLFLGLFGWLGATPDRLRYRKFDDRTGLFAAGAMLFVFYDNVFPSGGDSGLGQSWDGGDGGFDGGGDGGAGCGGGCGGA